MAEKKKRKKATKKVLKRAIRRKAVRKAIRRRVVRRRVRKAVRRKAIRRNMARRKVVRRVRRAVRRKVVRKKVARRKATRKKATRKKAIRKKATRKRATGKKATKAKKKGSQTVEITRAEPSIEDVRLSIPRKDWVRWTGTDEAYELWFKSSDWPFEQAADIVDPGYRIIQVPYSRNTKKFTMKAGATGEHEYDIRRASARTIPGPPDGPSVWGEG